MAADIVARSIAGAAFGKADIAFQTAAQISANAAGDVAHIKTLNTTTYPLVYCTDAGKQGYYKWDATYDKQRAKADAAEHRVISPNTASNGAWVRCELSTAERTAINAAYRRVYERWPDAVDRFEPGVDRVPLLGRRVNFNSASEDLSDGHYAKDCTLGSETMVHQGVALQRIHSMSGFFSGLRDFRSADYDLEDGVLYIASLYAAAPRPVLDQAGLEAPNTFMWMQAFANGTTYGHGAKLIFPTPRRVHCIIQGGSSVQTVRRIDDPTVAWASQTQNNQALQWVFAGYGHGSNANPPELWVGGMQIERAPNQSEKVGIVTLGTSIDVSGSGGGNGKDHWTQSRGWSRWLEGLLCAPIFPASIGGQTASQIDSRFNTDVAPLREHSKYIVLCVNVNDFASGFSSSAYRASWASIYAKAIAAGWAVDEIIWMTIQPRSIYDYANGAADLAAENAYIKATYRNVIDRGEAMQDAIDTGLLPTDYETDGIHQNAAASRALAFMIYNKYRHFFRFDNVPGPYQKTTNDDAKAQSFGEPLFDTLKGAVRLDAASSVSAYRDNDLASAPIVVFDGTAGSAKTFQLPGPKYQRATERVNTEILRQQFLNLTGDSQNVTIQYYQRDASNVLTTLGSAFVIPPGTSRTLCSDGVTVWTENATLAASTGWTADTGTAKKTANATYSGTAEVSYTQATIQTLMNTVRDQSQTVKALKDALIAAKVLTA